MEIVNIRFELPVDQHMALKLLTVKRRTNIKAVLVELVGKYLAEAQAEQK